MLYFSPSRLVRAGFFWGWKALCSHVDSDGRLGYVQPIGGSPASTTREMTEVYGVGAFLLAASEIVNM